MSPADGIDCAYSDIAAPRCDPPGLSGNAKVERPMDQIRHHGVHVAYVGVTVAVGLAIGSPVVAGIAAGLGTNALSPLTERAWRRCWRRLLLDDGLANHDLEIAMRAAFRDALDHLENLWWKTG